MHSVPGQEKKPAPAVYHDGLDLIYYPRRGVFPPWPSPQVVTHRGAFLLAPVIAQMFFLGNLAAWRLV